MAKISDLIAKCEESEMMTQNLRNNIIRMEIKKGQGEITFATDSQIVLDEVKGKPTKVGVVIWLPIDVFER